VSGDKIGKIGGTSSADVVQMLKSEENILREGYRYVIPSAPGKRFPGDDKMTDLLRSLRTVDNRRPYKENFQEIKSRLSDIVCGLGLSLDLQPYFDEIERAAHQPNMDFLVSRGEYIIGNIWAERLGFEFTDPVRFMRFSKSGVFNLEATERAWKRLKLDPSAKGFVVGGYYGADSRGEIKVFSRGGSDASGAVVAYLVDAQTYDNWTDVDGVCLADPRVLGKDFSPQPVPRNCMTFSEVLEAAYRGNEVLHQDVIPILRKKRIPVLIRNTNNPSASGTFIVPDDRCPRRNPGEVVCITGRRDVVSFVVQKDLMSLDIGYQEKVMRVLRRHKVNVLHTPGGNESITFVMNGERLSSKLEEVMDDINRLCKPDKIIQNPRRATICIVGRLIPYSRVHAALEKAKIHPRFIDKGDEDLSCNIGVDNNQYEDAIRALYAEFAH
jgi:aspartate kinase